MIPATHIAREALAALLAESRRRTEAARRRRDLAERMKALDWREFMTDEQRAQLALFEARARAGGLRRLPSIFAPLED